MKICMACDLRFDGAGWECPSCHFTPEIIAGHPAFSPELAETDTGFQAGYFDQLAALETSSFWFRSRNRLISSIIERHFRKTGNFFEIGCGTGFVLSGIERRFPHLLLSGSEIYTAGLAHCAKRLKSAELFQMDARHIPFEDQFDVIGAFDLLEHVEEDNQVLRQIYQAVKPGGGIILTVPQHPFLWSRLDEYACHFRRYRRRDLKARTEGAGFTVVRITSFVSLLLPLMMLARLKKRRPAPGCDRMSELKIGAFPNALLEKILDLEIRTILSGGSFPFGGSLLLVARK